MNKPIVSLSESDGNAFSILGKCTRALKKAGASEETIAEFMKEAQSGDYDNLLRTAMKFCEVE